MYCTHKLEMPGVITDVSLPGTKYWVWL